MKTIKGPLGCLSYSCTMLSLRKTNQIGLLHRQMGTLSCGNEKLGFYFCCSYDNKQHIMYRNFIESVYMLAHMSHFVT